MTKDLKAAKDKAAGYRGQNAEQPADQPKPAAKPRSPEEWSDLVGLRIEEAMRNGAFDNLPGQGKPLNLERNPFVPEDQQMALSLLKNNDLEPAWISERADIQRAVAALRSDIYSYVEQHRRTLAAAAGDAPARQRLVQAWQARLQKWEETVAALNRRIEKWNLQRPVAHLELFKLRLAGELSRAEASPDDRPSQP